MPITLSQSALSNAFDRGSQPHFTWHIPKYPTASEHGSVLSEILEFYRHWEIGGRLRLVTKHAAESLRRKRDWISMMVGPDTSNRWGSNLARRADW